MRVRSLSNSDVPALVGAIRAEEFAAIGHRETRDVDVVHLLTAPGLDLAERARGIFDDTGSLLGFVALHPAPQPGQLRAQLSVSPGADSVSTARMLLALLDAWVPVGQVVTAFALPGSPAGKALAEAGWTIVHSYSRMRIDMTGPPPVVPDEVLVGAAGCAAVHAVIEDAVDGHWNHHRRPFDEFWADQRKRDGHDPSLWLLAESGGHAGALIARAPADRAWIAWLGVLPDHRGQGVAQALLRTVFRTLYQRGHRSVGVDVDTHNSTGANRVYARAGMTLVGHADQWRKVY